MKLSIIIPCYNEGESIKILIEKCLNTINSSTEIILVDNGSNDETSKNLKNTYLPSNIKVVKIKKNIGYGNGILIGLNKARGEVLSWTHADLQTDPADIIIGYKKFKEELISKKCIVKGQRRNRNFLDSFFTICMGVYSSLILKSWLYDINAQPKIFHSSFLEKFKDPPIDFSLDLYVLYFFRFNNVQIKSIPVYFNKRKFGNAKGGGTLKGKLQLMIRTFSYIHKLNRVLKK